jgi:hypothetical protein
VVCTRCGAPTIDDLPFCFNCHHGVDAREFLRDVDPSKGVNGWLAVFVFLLKYVNPLLAAIAVMRWLKYGHVAAAPILPNAPIVEFLNVIACVLITYFGLYTAHNLQKVRPGAVNKAKRYLLFLFLYSVSVLLAIGSATLFHLVGTSEFRASLENFIGQIPWVAGWYLYFTRSKRVANTYLTSVAHS